MPASAPVADAQSYANRMNACKIQAEGEQRLYDAALVLFDYKDAEKHRIRLHELLDLELDCKAAMYSILQKASNIRK